jgi:hypothetical protein
MDWRIFISELVFRFEGLEAVLRLPATEEILEKCRNQLHLRALPKQLEELYRQTDGIGETLNGEKNRNFGLAGRECHRRKYLAQTKDGSWKKQD